MQQSTSTAASAEAAAKREAVLEAVSRRGFRGVIVTSAPSVRWLLCGRGRPVVFGGAAYTVAVGEEGTTVLHPDIEASRVEAEERLEELGVGVVTFPWHEGPDAVLAEVAPGFASEGDLADELGALRRKLRPVELERYRAAGRDTAAAMVGALAGLRPETSELEAAALLGAGCLARGLYTPVLLAGGEGRQEVHRHPIPTAAPLGGHALLAVTAEREGLHVSITRLISFGDPPPELVGCLLAAVEVDAAMLGASRPGTPVSVILRVAADAYARLGFPEEWRRHHQGGITGYAGREVFATPGDATAPRRRRRRLEPVGVGRGQVRGHGTRERRGRRGRDAHAGAPGARRRRSPPRWHPHPVATFRPDLVTLRHEVRRPATTPGRADP